MEKFFLKPRRVDFETWQLGLALLAAISFLIVFGASVERATRDYESAGLVERASLKIARIPVDTQRLVEEALFDDHPQLARGQRFDGQSGFDFQSLGTSSDLLLLSRFDGNSGRSVVELLDLKTGEIIHQYIPDINDLRKRIIESKAAKSVADVDPFSRLRSNQYAMVHPFLDESGSLIFADFHTPLVKVDVCSKIEWIRSGLFHHAIERDSAGNYWTIRLTAPPIMENRLVGFEQDTLVNISPSGEILTELFLTDILKTNGLSHLLYFGAVYDRDPTHLNDIQPVLKDGPFWKKGDIFLSIRNRSLIVLYRPSSGKVIWHKLGPWIMQHDVDIISDHEISVFSNNSTMGADGMYVLGSNQSIVYDFEADEIYYPYKDSFERLDISTLTEGLTSILPNGNIFVEEQDAGRLLLLDSDGVPIWTFVNRDSKGDVYRMHWSRYIGGAEAENLRERLPDTKSCTP